MTVQTEQRIIIYGHNHREFSNASAIIQYIKEGGQRYRYTQTKNVDVVVLSLDNIAYGYFEVNSKEKPNEQDRNEYPPVRCVYIVDKRVLFVNPVELSCYHVTVNSFGVPIPMELLETIKLQAGELVEFSHA